MRSKKFDDLVKKVPLEIRIEVTVQSHFLHHNGGTMFMPADESSPEYALAYEANRKALQGSSELIKELLDAVKEWKEAGCPE